jgi:HSP20 family protein
MSTLIPWGPRFVDPFAVAPTLFRRPAASRGQGLVRADHRRRA